MTNAAAGSKLVRRNIQGHIVVADEEAIKKLRRLSTGILSHVFMHAKEHGSTGVTLNDEHWTLTRQSDHTYTLLPGSLNQFSL